MALSMLEGEREPSYITNTIHIAYQSAESTGGGLPIKMTGVLVVPFRG